MPIPDVDEEDSKLRCECPFCSGVYSVTKGELRHTEPACAKWNEATPTAFLAEARQEQARKDAQKTKSAAIR